MSAMPLPEPTADALAASRALHQLISEDIRAHDDWISFARYMEMVLYAKDLGYYAGGAAKLGKDGDFTTAPEITPLFGATLALFAAELLNGRPLRILEFGAGTGKLAEQVGPGLCAALVRQAQQVSHQVCSGPKAARVATTDPGKAYQCRGGFHQFAEVSFGASYLGAILQGQQQVSGP